MFLKCKLRGSVMFDDVITMKNMQISCLDQVLPCLSLKNCCFKLIVIVFSRLNCLQLEFMNDDVIFDDVITVGNMQIR